MSTSIQFESIYYTESVDPLFSMIDNLQKFIKLVKSIWTDLISNNDNYFKSFGKELNSFQTQLDNSTTNNCFIRGKLFLTNVINQNIEWKSKMISIHEQIAQISGSDFENLFSLLNQLKELLVQELLQRSKQLTTAKQLFNKSKQTYERLCKSAEKHLAKFRKSLQDSNTKYNTVLLGTISAKVKNRLEQCNELEKSLINDQQNIFSQKLQLESKLKAGYENVKETTVKVIQGVAEIASVWSDVNRTCLLWMGSGTDLIKKIQCSTYEEFEEEIEDQDYLKFCKIITKQSEGEVDWFIFPELAENNFEKFQSIISIRNAVIKYSEGFINEWASQIDSFVKNGNRTLKVWQSQCQSLSNSLSQKIIILIKFFQEIMEFWLKQFGNLSQFLNEKGIRVGKIVKEQKHMGKNMCNEIAKMLKDVQTAKNQILKVTGRSMSDPDKTLITESKVTQFKTEGDDSLNEENKVQFQKVVRSTIAKMTAQFKDLYDNEVKYFKGVQDSFESVMIQQCLIFNELSNHLNTYAKQNEQNKISLLSEIENFSQFNNKLKIYESEEIIKDKILFIVHKFSNLPQEIFQLHETAQSPQSVAQIIDQSPRLPQITDLSENPTQEVQEKPRTNSENLMQTINLQETHLQNENSQQTSQEASSMIEASEIRRDCEPIKEEFTMIASFLEQNNKTALLQCSETQKEGYLQKFYPAKVKVKSKLLTKFQIPLTQKCIGEFSCGFYFNNMNIIIRFLNKIILQGTLYVFQNKICFHSYFNDKNFIFGRTYQAIPVSDILRIEKRSYMLFDTAICFITIDKCELTFASVLYKFLTNLLLQFISRDKTFDILQNVLKLVGKNFEFKEKNPENSEQLLTEEQIGEEEQQIIEEQKQMTLQEIQESKVEQNKEENTERKTSIYLQMKKNTSQTEIQNQEATLEKKLSIYSQRQLQQQELN